MNTIVTSALAGVIAAACAAAGATAFAAEPISAASKPGIIMSKPASASEHAASMATPAKASTPLEAYGVVKSIDSSARKATLEGGASYGLPLGYDASKLKPGDKVTIAWREEMGAREANAITIVGPDEHVAQGAVKTVNAGARTLTLATGVAFKLPTAFEPASLKPGEKVAVVWKKEGTVNQAEAIAQ